MYSPVKIKVAGEEYVVTEVYERAKVFNSERLDTGCEVLPQRQGILGYSVLAKQWVVTVQLYHYILSEDEFQARFRRFRPVPGQLLHAAQAYVVENLTPAKTAIGFPVQMRCAYCNKEEPEGAKHQVCKLCKLESQQGDRLTHAYYCSRECCKLHWQVHKKEHRASFKASTSSAAVAQ